MLTATRAAEVRGAVWDEMDTKEAVWTIPASRYKTRRDHRVPLSQRALEILNEARRLGNGDGFVFPGDSEDGRLSDDLMEMEDRLIERMDERLDAVDADLKAIRAHLGVPDDA